MLDVDNLKEYNGRFGHLEGSQVLKHMASVLRAGTRDTDLVAKYGGDEFMVVLPHSTREGATLVAERLRQAVADSVFPHVAAGEITCSIGIAVFPEDASQPMALVGAADQALFAAKGAGKNRIAA
jgi:diguanylate cyclase (GGDEF)-like protein